MDWRYRHRFLGLSLLAFFGTQAARLVISPLIPTLMETFEIEKGAVGLALTAMWGAYALAQFPSGVLSDCFGERKVIMASLGLTGVGSLLVALSPSSAYFVVFIIVLGVGTGLYYSAATSLLTKLFSNTGQAIGIHVLGGPLAGLVAPIVVTYISIWYHWRVALTFGAALSFPLFLAFWGGIRPTPPHANGMNYEELLRVEYIVDLVGRPAVTYTIILAIVGSFSWQATASFLPTFLQEYHGLSSQFAAVLFGVFFLVMGAMQAVSGWLSDRFDRGTAIGLNMFAGLTGFGLLVATDTLLVLLVGIAVTGFAMSWGAPIHSRFMDLFDDDDRGTHFGLVRTLYLFVGALGSTVIGVLSDRTSWLVAFGLLAGLTGFGLLLAISSRVLDREL